LEADAFLWSTNWPSPPPSPAWPEASSGSADACSPVNFCSLLLAAWLVPAFGAYQIPVAIYLLCLYAIAFMACRVEDKTGLLWLGAMLFVIAGTMIGVNKFAMPFAYAYAVPVIVTTYFTGQVLIGLGVLRLKGRGHV